MGTLRLWFRIGLGLFFVASAVALYLIIGPWKREGVASTSGTDLFPREAWNRLHLQIIYFGREHCPALRHDLSTCPICSWAATRKRIAEESRRAQAPTRTAM